MKLQERAFKDLHDKHNVENVPYAIFRNRIVNLGWDPKQAGSVKYTPGTEEMRRCMALYERQPIRLVDFETFHRRLRNGLAPEQAASNPPPEVNETMEYYRAFPNPAVDYRRFRARVMIDGWDREKAITTPLTRPGRNVKKRVLLTGYYPNWYYANQQRSAVPVEEFIRRVTELAWDRERALTEPPSKKINLREIYNNNPKKNLTYTNFRRRIDKGWSVEKSLNTPVALRANSRRASV